MLDILQLVFNLPCLSLMGGFFFVENKWNMYDLCKTFFFNRRLIVRFPFGKVKTPLQVIFNTLFLVSGKIEASNLFDSTFDS